MLPLGNRAFFRLCYQVMYSHSINMVLNLTPLFMSGPFSVLLFLFGYESSIPVFLGLDLPGLSCSLVRLRRWTADCLRTSHRISFRSSHWSYLLGTSLQALARVVAFLASSSEQYSMGPTSYSSSLWGYWGTSDMLLGSSDLAHRRMYSTLEQGIS